MSAAHAVIAIRDKKFWEELIRILFLNTSLYAMVVIVTLAKDCM
jgi:hypothetical protein